MIQKAWRLISKEAIGPIQFGMQQKEVRAILGKEYRPFRKSIFAKSTTDAYANLHVYYSSAGEMEAIEFFGDHVVELNGVQLFPGTVEHAQKLLTDLAYEAGSYISKKHSIGMYAPEQNGNIESILVAIGGYYK